MNRSSKRCSALVLCILAGSAIATTPAKAQLPPGCPQSLCACLGAATKYAIVGDKFFGVPGVFHEVGNSYTEIHGFGVSGSVCAIKAKLTSRRYADDANVSEDLVLLAAKGTAAQFHAHGSGYNAQLYLGGDLVTAGGKTKGLGSIWIAGGVDTTGSNAKLHDCAQARLDMAAASVALLALTPTQTIPAIDARGATPAEINAGPGVNVIRVPSIRVSASGRGYYSYSGALNINLDPATESVIINVDESVDVGMNSTISVDGDFSKVIINVSPKEGGTVRVGIDANVDPLVLVGKGKVTGLFHAQFTRVFASRAMMEGSLVNESFEPFCE